MRCLIKVQIPVELGNQMIAEGRLAPTLEAILTELKPEASYFALENGQRAAYIFADIADPSRIPAICEPFFFAAGARVDVSPAMTIEDLSKAGPAIEKAAKTFGKARQGAPAR